MSDFRNKSFITGLEVLKLSRIQYHFWEREPPGKWKYQFDSDRWINTHLNQIEEPAIAGDDEIAKK
jgi:hypothetical protein